MKKIFFFVFLFSLSFSLFQLSVNAETLSDCEKKNNPQAKVSCIKDVTAQAAQEAKQKAENLSRAAELNKEADDLEAQCKSNTCNGAQKANIVNLRNQAKVYTLESTGASSDELSAAKQQLQVSQKIFGARTSEASADVAISNTRARMKVCDTLAKTDSPCTDSGTLSATLEKYSAEKLYQDAIARCAENETVCGDVATTRAELDKKNLAYAASAQSALATQQMKLCNYGICFSNIKTIEKLAENIIKFLARLIAILAVCAFMVGGFLMIIRIDDEGRAQAKAIMINSIIAVVVVLSAYVIVSFIQQVLYSLGK